ncbi:MAG: 50S ribosomal protein L18 [Gemmatimonadales bacterium]|nr:50S ribosomal protein L18 [Gemmatimonadales bacterium]NIN48620.1 50S ribosomal protein L18 [Gemmatimonadales bacterium]NIP06084.1 50S ribosomal protein L18 [Gemmatimonadales bacterium]NIR01258.1 50S ribosomal protein L18 [Gemmatimonadales bacterium]
MRAVRKPKTRAERRHRRHLRARKRIAGTAERPRLVVYRSIKYTYAQLVDDDRGVTLASASERSEGYERNKAGKVGAAFGVGKLIAKRAGELGITRVVFDRGGYPYHGRIKAVAEGARDGGLEF